MALFHPCLSQSLVPIQPMTFCGSPEISGLEITDETRRNEVADPINRTYQTLPPCHRDEMDY